MKRFLLLLIGLMFVLPNQLAHALSVYPVEEVTFADLDDLFEDLKERLNQNETLTTKDLPTFFMDEVYIEDLEDQANQKLHYSLKKDSQRNRLAVTVTPVDFIIDIEYEVNLLNSQNRVPFQHFMSDLLPEFNTLINEVMQKPRAITLDELIAIFEKVTRTHYSLEDTNYAFISGEEDVSIVITATVADESDEVTKIVSTSISALAADSPYMPFRVTAEDLDLLNISDDLMLTSVTKEIGSPHSIEYDLVEQRIILHWWSDADEFLTRITAKFDYDQHLLSIQYKEK